MKRKLWKFNGGLELPGHKGLSTGSPIVQAPIPKYLILPLQQHIGSAAKPIIEIGDKVLKGQVLARAEGFVSAPVHASSSGTVIAIEKRAVPHPSGLDGQCIVIETDGQDTWIKHQPVADYTQLDPSALRNLVREAGIIGLGGAGFPSFIKLNPGPRTQVDTLVLNAAECEPYITCDEMLIRERAEEIIAGAQIMSHALNARQCIVGIENDEPEAISALETALAGAKKHLPQSCENIEVVPIPARYPTGGEKQLIKVLTGKEVPTQGLPIDIGIVCSNVATAASIFHAVINGKPLISRILTVSGEAANSPQNLEVRVGTPIKEILEAAGGTSPDLGQLIMGGPMMGHTLNDIDAPVVKTTNCLLATKKNDASTPTAVLSCIRCGECARVCPVNLLPQQLYWYSQSKEFDKVQDYNLFDCIECGCCSYVCPSKLPLVQYYRFAKNEIWDQEREKKKSDLARERHEFRQHRIDREKAERAARLRKKKEALESGTTKDTKKAAIDAAMARAKAKKEASDVVPANTDNLTAEQQKKIAEVDTIREAASETKPGEH